MKLSPKIIFALIIFVIGMAAVTLGALLKINKYQDGIIAGNNFIVLGMLLELGSIYLIAMNFLKKPNK